MPKALVLQSPPSLATLAPSLDRTFNDVDRGDECEAYEDPVLQQERLFRCGVEPSARTHAGATGLG
jgi:hypothetical protein